MFVGTYTQIEAKLIKLFVLSLTKYIYVLVFGKERYYPAQENDNIVCFILIQVYILVFERKGVILHRKMIKLFVLYLSKYMSNSFWWIICLARALEVLKSIYSFL